MESMASQKFSHGKEAAVEEVEHGKAAQATNHDDDGRLTCTPWRMRTPRQCSLYTSQRPSGPASGIIDAKRLPQAVVDEPKTPAPIITTKVKSLPKGTPRQSNPAMSSLPRTHLHDTDLEAKLNQGKLYMAELKQAKQEL
ncbi:hypothetical protein TI39_contig281g00003 [Zymoseptoria brevis]|uniref:Uncharacterized protein n=1 Tax=Zymoseptoria brevis TaxID=1047168 RepID=A0A0F4GZQ9_9PEZI|nr:hypothetical protein TI39_contig281g00003 [Zymoseptoria brevis]